MTPRRRIVARAGLLAWGALILMLTLFPVPGGTIPETSFCLICGGRGLADGILNVGLFLPLGWTLAASFDGWRRMLVPAVVLTVAIEWTQVAIPGRHPSLGDVVYNAAGAALGVLLCATWRRWLFPALARRRRLSYAAAAAATSVLVATAVLLEPSFPDDSPYFGQWTPDLGHLERYEGRVRSARIGDMPIGPDRVGARGTLLAELHGGPEVRVDAEAGPPPPDLAPIFSVFDGRSREVVLVGADRRDLVYRKRLRTAEVRIDSPDWRWRGGLEGVGAGQRVTLGVRDSARGGVCLSVDARTLCGIGHTVASGWTMLLSRPARDPGAEAVLGWLWLGALLLPVGWWAPSVGTAVVGAAAPVAAAALLPLGTSLLATGPAGFLAMALGLGAGGVGGSWARALRGRRSTGA